MLLSPLMAPILGLGLALAIGDLYLGVKSAANCLFSTVLVVGLSALITLLIPFQEVTREIASRIQPNPLDLFIALFCGIIAAVSAARAPDSGIGTTLPGVAIAVALVPPLCVAGWGLGAGPQWSVFRGGMVLFLTNLTAIILTSLLFFLLIRMGAPAHSGALRAFISERESGKRLHDWLESHPWAGQFRRIGTLRNRVLVVALAVAVLFVPLYSGLRQVKYQLLVKTEVGKALGVFLPDQTVLSRTVTAGRDGAEVSLVLLAQRASPELQVRAMEEYLRMRLGEQFEDHLHRGRQRDNRAVPSRRPGGSPTPISSRALDQTERSGLRPAAGALARRGRLPPPRRVAGDTDSCRPFTAASEVCGRRPHAFCRDRGISASHLQVPDRFLPRAADGPSAQNVGDAGSGSVEKPFRPLHLDGANQGQRFLLASGYEHSGSLRVPAWDAASGLCRRTTRWRLRRFRSSAQRRSCRTCPCLPISLRWKRVTSGRSRFH